MEDMQLTVSDNHNNTPDSENKPALSDILSRIDAIIAQGDELGKVVDRIVDIPVNDSINGGYDGQSRADAIGNIYVAREKTNQQMLTLLNRMYDDMTCDGKGPSKDKDERLIALLRSVSFAGVGSDGIERIMNFISDALNR